MKKRSVLYNFFLTKLILSPLTYITAVFTVLMAALQYFFFNNFFSATGTSDLKSFFEIFPYISILAVPALCHCINFKISDNALPFSTENIFISKNFSLYTVQFFILLLTIPLPLVVTFFGNIEVSQFLCGYLGLFLFYICVISVCVFFDSVFENKILSFFISALILGLFNIAHLLNLYLSSGNFFSYIFKFFSFAWHFNSFGRGIIVSRDVFFFLLTALLFIFLSIVINEFKRGYHSKNFSKLIALTLIFFSLSYTLSQRLYFRIDTSSSKKYSVSTYTKNMLSKIEEPLNITYYRSSALTRLYPQISDVKDFLDEYVSCKKNINLYISDPQKTNSISILNQYGIYPQQIESSASSSKQITQVYSAIVIEYLSKVQVIPFVSDTSLLEYDLDYRISDLISNNTNNRKIQLLCGNELNLEKDFYNLHQWLLFNGFEVVDVRLSSNAKDLNLPVLTDNPSIPLLVLGTNAFTAEDTELLENYLLSQGKAIICSAPYSINIHSDWSYEEKKDRVVRLLNSFGVLPEKQFISDIKNYKLTLSSVASDNSQNIIPQKETVSYAQWPLLESQEFAKNGMILFWPSALTLEDYEGVKPLLLTSPTSWKQKKTDGTMITNPFVCQKTSDKNDITASFAVAAEINGEQYGFYTTRKGNVHAIVFGDQYCFTNAMFDYTAGDAVDLRAYEFLIDCILKIRGEEELSALRQKEMVNTSLYKIPAENLGQLKIPVTCTVIFVSLFILCLVLIAVIFTRRKFNGKGKNNESFK